MRDLNRIKVVLVEKKQTTKWLAEELGRIRPQLASGALTCSSQTCTR